MIISASRRTDIPTYYSEWFFNRLKEGYLFVRNPLNYHQISRIDLSPDLVDGIVFWTKNPVPMMDRLDELKGYNYYFQFTLNAYGRDVEPNIPTKKDIIIPAFQELSKKIGKERVIWRYDPIFFNDKYTMDYHLKYFRKLAEMLHEYTEKCTVSFLDVYGNVENNIRPLNIVRNVNKSLFKETMVKLSEIAKEYGLYVDTCAERIDLTDVGIGHASCIDKERLERISGCKMKYIRKDKYQRKECGCIASADIGSYNTCKGGCLYCYASDDQMTLESNCKRHDPNSPVLFGEITDEDCIRDRKKMKSYVDNQVKMFDDGEVD